MSFDVELYCPTDRHLNVTSEIDQGVIWAAVGAFAGRCGEFDYQLTVFHQGELGNVGALVATECQEQFARSRRMELLVFPRGTEARVMARVSRVLGVIEPAL